MLLQVVHDKEAGHVLMQGVLIADTRQTNHNKLTRLHVGEEICSSEEDFNKAAAA